MEIILDDDLIGIKLSDSNFDNYNKSQHRFSQVMINTIIFPMLIYVFEYIKRNKNDEEMITLMWYKVLEEKLESVNIDIDDVANDTISSFEVCTIILNNPMERMFIELSEVFNDEK